MIKELHLVFILLKNNDAEFLYKKKLWVIFL